MSANERRLSKIFRPVITAAAFGAVLAGCAPAAMDHDADDASASSSVSSDDTTLHFGDGVMDDDAMMDDDDHMVKSEDTMMKDEDTMQKSQAPASPSSAAAVKTSTYRDGTYSATGIYRSPAGGEAVDVTITLKGDLVTAATFHGEATHEKSMAMQQAFGSGFEQLVVGKSIDQVSVGVVNGSSLTGIGFMDAVSKIKAEAKA